MTNEEALVGLAENLGQTYFGQGKLEALTHASRIVRGTLTPREARKLAFEKRSQISGDEGQQRWRAGYDAALATFVGVFQTFDASALAPSQTYLAQRLVQPVDVATSAREALSSVPRPVPYLREAHA